MTTVTKQLADIEARLEAVEAALAATAEEVRTKRLVVVDAHGRERIATRMLDGQRSATLRVSANDDTFIEIVGHCDEDDNWAGLTLVGAGNSRGRFIVEECVGECPGSGPSAPAHAYVELEDANGGTTRILSSDQDVVKAGATGPVCSAASCYL